MIGNDIVDLALAKKESNWKRKGFLDKIFTQSEQLLILNSQNSENMVWNLWSRKEAAYKIYNRQTGIRIFNPLQLLCIFESETAGFVKIKEHTYFTKTTISDQCIHTIAVINFTDFETIHYMESTKNILKINGIPNWYDSHKSVLKPASISHHGKFTKIIAL